MDEKIFFFRYLRDVSKRYTCIPYNDSELRKEYVIPVFFLLKILVTFKREREKKPLENSDRISSQNNRFDYNIIWVNCICQYIKNNYFPTATWKVNQYRCSIIHVTFCFLNKNFNELSLLYPIKISLNPPPHQKNK